MTLKEYFKLTLFTTKNCLKISGSILTIIFVIIWILSGEAGTQDSIIEFIGMSIIMILLGNAFGLGITVTGIMVGYGQVKRETRLYEGIPEEIKKQYMLEKTFVTLSPKYNYPTLMINSTKPNAPFLIFKSIKGPLVHIIVLCNLENKDFISVKTHLSRKYQHDQIEISDIGIIKIIKPKKFKELTSSELENIIERLIEITRLEGLEIVTYNLSE